MVASAGTGTFIGGWMTMVFIVAGVCAVSTVVLVFLSAQAGPQRLAPVAAAVGAAVCGVGVGLAVAAGGSVLDHIMPLVGGTVALFAFVALLVRTRSWFRA
jgi:hypothetical protein